MPEANASMQDLSSILGDIMNNSSVGSADMGISEHVSGETSSILAEAQSLLESQAKSTIPDIPSELQPKSQRSRTLI